MVRWNLQGAHSAVGRRPLLCARSAALCAPTRSQCRQLSTPVSHATPSSPSQERPARRRRYPTLKKIALPQGDADARAAVLDGALPPHLRDSSTDASPPNLSAVDVAEILLAAQHPVDPNDEPLDLLFHIGYRRSRWTAVVWLIKQLIDRFPVRHGRPSRLSQVNAVWSTVPDLRSATLRPLDLDQENSVPSEGQAEVPNFQDLLDGPPENLGPAESFEHAALGQIWRTLGTMTQACSGREIMPEVLEIIAYLHHREVMPMSIYQSERHQDPSAIQQPPLLSFLSSRIMTSLSDAAWRAHEKLVVEEAKAAGGEHGASRPELPGTVYRVHVAGIRPEAWMELILWSCIRGGWIRQGADLLRSIVNDTTSPKWKALSWRDYEKATLSEAGTDGANWNDLEFAFKTGAASSMESRDGPKPKVRRTVSAEVVNAYIDALVSDVSVGVGHRGIGMDDLIQRLRELKMFLRRKVSKKPLSLSTGSWDGLITRIVDNQSVIPESETGTIQNLVAFSPGFSQGLGARNTHDLPEYVLDGGTALQGLLHRALFGQIASGSFEGAVKVFEQMQTRADEDKMKSVADFFGSEDRSSPYLTDSDMFTGNLHGIDYPAFNVRIPPPILGSFLDLAMATKAYDFARWMLYNDDVDGPIIPESLYTDANVQPAVIRFAAETNDQVLFAKLKRLHLFRGSLQTVLDAEVDALHWSAARRMLDLLSQTRGRTWHVQNLANLIRVMLLQLRDATSGVNGSRHHVKNAQIMIANLVQGRYEGGGTMHARKSVEVQNLLAVLSAVEPALAQFCASIRPSLDYQRFILSAKQFNTVLEGVVAAFGSIAGRRLLGIFWPHRARSAHNAAYQLSSDKANIGKMARFRPNILESLDRQRIVVHPSRTSVEDQDFVLYGALTPNTKTILIILSQALESIVPSSDADAPAVPESGMADLDHVKPNAGRRDKDQVDSTHRGMVEWAIRRLAELPYVEGSIITYLDKVLEEKGLDDLRAELPEIVQIVQADAVAEAEAVAEADEDSEDKYHEHIEHATIAAKM